MKAEESKKMQKIWINEKTGNDTYVDFTLFFSVDPKRKTVLKIACDSMYAVWINGILIGFGQCSDYPWHKYYDEMDVSAFLKKENRIDVTVWYTGYDCLTYFSADPMLAFEIEQGGKVVLQSSEDVKCRRNPNYKNGYCKPITTQMGYSFYYDNTAENDAPYENCIYKGEVECFSRGIDNLVLNPRKNTDITRTDYGYFIDLFSETVGFADLEFTSPVEQEILIAYGEHAEDGSVSRKIAYRDFSVEFKAKKGENKYMNPFRRLACRYLQIFCSEPLDVKYIGIRPTTRNHERIKREFGDDLTRKIYETSLHTLMCCMHEHYEDCPWREQALYNMDSRNQMLCGYFAFKDSSFQRFNLTLMAHGIQDENGLLGLCFPSNFERRIPFFSLVYVLQIYEYIKYTGDKSILVETADTVRKILSGFSARLDENNLLACFSPPVWNFYEWSDESCGVNDKIAGEKKIYDLILNCMFVYATRLADKIFDTETDTERIERAIVSEFYDKNKGLFKSCTYGGPTYTCLGNSLAVLIGLGGEDIAEKLMVGEGVEKVSLSMNTFFYDALLSFGTKYKDFVLDDIKKKYKPMLDAGATTFWETELGYKDFGGAGSLCHGWSAMPIYYYVLLGCAV